MKIRNMKPAALLAALVVVTSCALAQDSLGLPAPAGEAAPAKQGAAVDQKATETQKAAADTANKAKLEKRLEYAKKIRDFPNCPKEDWDWAVAQIKSIESQLRIIKARADVADRKIHRLNSVVFDKRRGVKALDRAVFDKKTGLEARVKALEDKLNPPAESKDQPAAKDDPSSKETKQPDAKEADKPAEKADQPAKQGAAEEAAPTDDSGRPQVAGLSGQGTQPNTWWSAPPYWGYIVVAAVLVIVALVGYVLGWWQRLWKRLGW